MNHTCYRLPNNPQSKGKESFCDFPTRFPVRIHRDINVERRKTPPNLWCTEQNTANFKREYYKVWFFCRFLVEFHADFRSRRIAYILYWSATAWALHCITLTQAQYSSVSLDLTEEEEEAMIAIDIGARRRQNGSAQVPKNEMSKLSEFDVIKLLFIISIPLKMWGII